MHLAIWLLAAAVIFLASYSFKLTVRFNVLLARFNSALGSTNERDNLESLLKRYFDLLNLSKQRLDSIDANYTKLSQVHSTALQKIGLVRFNPFRDTGGNQSFVLCLLNSHNSGLLLTAIHGRDGSRIYCKSVKFGHADTKLSDEEKHALSQAQEVGFE